MCLTGEPAPTLDGTMVGCAGSLACASSESLYGVFSSTFLVSCFSSVCRFEVLTISTDPRCRLLMLPLPSGPGGSGLSGPRMLAYDPAPLLLPTYSRCCFGRTARADGYHPLGMNPSTSCLALPARMTATSLLSAFAAYSNPFARSSASALGVAPSGACG